MGSRTLERTQSVKQGPVQVGTQQIQEAIETCMCLDRFPLLSPSRELHYPGRIVWEIVVKARHLCKIDDFL